MVSKMPKKFKPSVTKPVKVKEEISLPEIEHGENPAPGDQPVSSSVDSTAVLEPHDGYVTPRATLVELMDQLLNRDIDLEGLAFFNPSIPETKVQTPLKYGPLVHALSALSVGGGTFANTLPSGSIDTAVSSFQQLLETLTQTISDLLRLLPRNTWDDSSSFDGVLRDMLKGDDFLEENRVGQDNALPGIREDIIVEGREDEVAVLTQALEKRARWMEVQLAKLEELHRDINTAAVRRILALNDAGWDRIAPDSGRFDHVPEVFLPRTGGTLHSYDNMISAASKMTVEELEARLFEAQEHEMAAEDALMRVMNSNAELLGYD
jgi:CCR4-NOT transcription complex subunit 4